MFPKPPGWDVLAGILQAGLGVGVLAQIAEGKTLDPLAQQLLVGGMVLATIATVFLAHMQKRWSLEDEDDENG
jgi:xanthine/uracil permease